MEPNLKQRQFSEAFDLSRFDDAFSHAMVFRPGEEEVAALPDGIYDVVIERVIQDTSRNGKPMIVWYLRLLDPRFSGLTIRKERFVTEKTIAILKDDFQRCGLQLDRLSEFPERADEMTGVEVRLEKRMKSGWPELYFR